MREKKHPAPRAGRRHLRLVPYAAGLVALTLHCAVPAGAAQEKGPPIQARTMTYFVNVYRVIKRLDQRKRRLFEVSCEYDFTDRRRVFIPGRGLASAKGSFSFLTAEDRLVFLETAGGRQLVSLKLYETAVPQGEPERELPDESQFPTAFAEARWPEPETFSAAAEAILKARYGKDFLAAEMDGADYYVTTYRDLPAGAKVRSQIALVVSRPRPGGGHVFRVQYVARERDPGKTEWRYGEGVSPATHAAAREFVAAVLNAFARRAEARAAGTTPPAAGREPAGQLPHDRRTTQAALPARLR